MLHYTVIYMYDFGDAAPVLHDNNPRDWQRSLPHPFVRGNGGGIGLSLL